MAKTKPKKFPNLLVRDPEFIRKELSETPDLDDIPLLYREEENVLNKKRDEGIRKLKLENDRLQAENDKITGDNQLRKTLSTLIFLTVFAWLAAVIFILCKVGYGYMCLSDKVLITLLTTTSINVIGLLVIVANYLFNKNKST